MRVDGREITVSGSLLQPLTRRTNDILRVVLAALFLAIVIAGSLITRNNWVAAREIHLQNRRSSDPHPGQSCLSDLRRRDSGVAVRDPDQPCCQPSVETPRRVRCCRVYLASRPVDQRQRHRRAEMALRPVRPARHDLVAVHRRPAVDRDARRGAHGVGPLAARAVASVVVDAAAGLRADPPRRQRRGAGPLVAGAGGGLVRRRIGGPGRRDPRVGGAARGRRPGDGQARIFRGRAHGSYGRRGTDRSSCPRRRRNRIRSRSSRCTARTNAAAARCASSGRS